MSQMFTTCPACRSNLAVTAADLRIGQGYVRCGRCDRVFNALMTLSEDMDTEDLSGLAATGTTTMPALDYPGDEHADDDLAEEDGQERAPGAAASAARGNYPVDVVESQATGTFETIVLEGDGYLQTEEHVDQGIVEARLSELTRQIDNDAAEEEQEEVHPDEEIVLETTDEVPDEDFDADAAVGNRRRHHWVWWLAAIVLALALAALLLHGNRQALVVHPWFQRPVQSFYQLFGITVEPQWDVNAYDLRQLGGDVLIGDNDSFTVQASVHNRAPIAQPPPVIRVKLQDRFSNPLSTMDIPPAEYLLNAAPARMAPDQRFDITLRLVDASRQAAGFVLDACLPAAGGTLRCSAP
jgi:predicted Zn finger-like uncharacterized protein